MFKVGDRVWNKKKKCLDTVQEVMYESYVLKSDIRFTVGEQDLHQTAQTMFEALGYEEDYIPYYCGHKENKGKLLLSRTPYENDERKEIIMFNLYSKDYQTYGISGTALHIDNDLHLAIHQKLIELGYLEWKSN